MISPKQNKTLAAPNPLSVRETINKVDECLIRLQEIQGMLSQGTKQEPLRMNKAQRMLPKPANLEGEWRQMSLPAMLVDETVGEILQASQFARKIVSTVGNRRTTTTEGPKTPPSQRSNHKVDPENTQLEARRKKEKKITLHSDSPPPQRARSRIIFKDIPPKVRELHKENKRVSPNEGPYTSKTVTFPKPLFLPSCSSQQQHFCKTRSPVISRNRGTQHKFMIKSPPPFPLSSKFEGKVKSLPIVSVSSPTKVTSLSKKSSPKRWARPFSPSRVAKRLASPLKGKKIVQKSGGLNKSSPKRSSGASKLCRSFSPSRLARRLVSPLKSKKSAEQRDGAVRGVKQRPASSFVQIPATRIKNIL